MPTETVYGMAGDALNPAALAGIFEIKRRPFFDPLIVHIESVTEVSALCAEIPADAQRLMDVFWPGPLTLVLPRTARVPDLVTAGLETVAVRMPAHPVARALLHASGLALAAPSANPFGGLSPTTAAHVVEAFADDPTGLLDCVLDGGPCLVGVESTVVGFEEGAPVLLRAGGIARETLDATLGRRVGDPSPRAEAGHGPVASPGALPWHYAPRTPVRLLGRETDEAPRGDAALVWFGPENAPEGYRLVENLSRAGDAREAAANLFAALHRLDATGVGRIDARLLPDAGLGLAVNDRLRKAAAKTASGRV